ncbi:MAG: ABC transporter substrate-binding protein [Ahrensia sp.]|nr:ABC transporter substrate-binding protein [Ahrensia sp.]
MSKLKSLRNLALAGVAAAGLMSSAAFAEIKVGFIGSTSSDTGLSTLRGAEMAIEELNAAGGVMGEQIKLVTADTQEDVTEGVKAYEYLAETEEVDFIISGSIDDVSLGWIPRMREYQIPTLDTWTSSITIIDMVVEDPDTMAPYFMNIASDEALATLYINFGKDVLKNKMGFESVVILAEDTAFGQAITGLVTEALAPVAGIEVKEVITYDIGTNDFAPIFSKAQASGADFIYQVSSVNSQVISSQYVKLQVPMAMTGVNVAALGMEYWEDTGGAGGGISTLSPLPSVGFKLDPTSADFVKRYQAKYDSRPRVPHFNGFNAYYGLKQAMAAAEAAGGFGDAKKWAAEMEKQDLKLELDGKLWLRYAFWGKDEVEEVTQRTYPHNARFDLTAPYDDAQPSMVVVQWKEDGSVGVVYPFEYATTEFELPSWVKQ